jgi:hypothetical protein
MPFLSDRRNESPGAPVRTAGAPMHHSEDRSPCGGRLLAEWCANAYTGPNAGQVLPFFMLRGVRVRPVATAVAPFGRPGRRFLDGGTGGRGPHMTKWRVRLAASCTGFRVAGRGR